MEATYPAIEAHGLIGDLQTAALISADGAVDWFCAPRFDSPSVFAALLDHDKGGHFRLTPDGIDYTSKQLYLPGTPILITRFHSADGVGELLDFMPVTGERATDQHRLIRLVRMVRGACGSASTAVHGSTTGVTRTSLRCTPRATFSGARL